MLYFRYRGSVVLVHVFFLAASWLSQADGAKNAQSCSGRKDEDGDLLGPGSTPSMVQRRDILESAMEVTEERPEVPEAEAPDARLSKKEVPEVAAVRLSKVDAPEMAAPHALQSKVKETRAPRLVAQPQQQLPNKSHTSSPAEAGSSRDVGSLMEALNRKYTATSVAGAQLLRSMKRQVTAEFRNFLQRLGILELELVTTRRKDWTMVFVGLLVVLVIVLLIAMRAWWKDTLANKERDGWWDSKSQPWQARGTFREAPSVPQPQQVSQASQPPSVMGLHASPGKPRELMPGKTLQKSATPLVQQTDLQSERRLATPTGAPADSPRLSLDELARAGHLCSELVVPEHNECSLLLPDIIENMSGVLSINDVNGMAVLYAAYSLAERPPAGPHDLPGNSKRLILRSALEDIILASCKDAEPQTAGGPPQLAVFNKSEELFGILRATSPGPRSSYLLSLSAGKKMAVRRDIQALSSCVTDEDGWLLACIEDAGECGRTLRISPQVDAGLMTLIMLAIDILDITVAAHGSSGHALPPGHASHPHKQQSRTPSR